MVFCCLQLILRTVTVYQLIFRTVTALQNVFLNQQAFFYPPRMPPCSIIRHETISQDKREKNEYKCWPSVCYTRIVFSKPCDGAANEKSVKDRSRLQGQVALKDTNRTRPKTLSCLSSCWNQQHSALSTSVPHDHALGDCSCTGWQCCWQGGRWGCSQSAGSRQTEAPWRSSGLGSSYLLVYRDKLLPGCWYCNGKYVSWTPPEILINATVIYDMNQVYQVFWFNP